MAIHDRIRTTTTQTGVLTTVDVSASAPSGFKKFSATGRFAVNDANIPVVIAHQSINEWQVCFCTYSATDQLTVNTVLASSKSDDTAVSFTAGTKDVFVTNSSKAIAALREANTFTGNNTFPNTGLKVQDTDASHVLTLASGALTANRTLTLTTGSAADRTLDISAANVTISTAGAALIDDASATEQRATLGLGAIALRPDIVDADVNASAAIAPTKLAFTQAGTGASARTVDAKLKEYVSLADFGADKTGATDCRTAVVNAVAAAKAAGVPLFIPEGQYLINPAGGSIVLQDVTLVGVGVMDGNNDYAAWNNGSMFRIASTGSGTSPFLIRRGVTLDGISWYYPSQTATFVTSPAVYAPTLAFDYTDGAVQFVYIRNCVAFNSWRWLDMDGLVAGSGAVGHVHIENNTICGISRCIEIGWNLENIKIRGNTFSFGHWNSADQNKTTTLSAAGYMRGSGGQAGAVAVYYQKGDGIWFCDNLIFGYKVGILMEANNLVGLCVINNNSFDQVLFGVAATGNGASCQFTKSQIVGNIFIAYNAFDTSLSGIGVLLGSGGAAGTEHMVITGNNFANSRENAIQIQGTNARRVVISGNAFSGVATLQTSGSWYCVSSSGANSDILFSGNTVFQDNGTYAGGIAASAANAISIDGNDFRNCKEVVKITATGDLHMVGNRSAGTVGTYSDDITGVTGTIRTSGNNFDKPNPAIGNRIRSDFSNATVNLRTAFQTSATNGNTSMWGVPNGTATTAAMAWTNNPDPTNASYMQIGMFNNEAKLVSSSLGSGTNYPLTITTGGSERARLDTNGVFMVNTTALGGLTGLGGLSFKAALNGDVMLGTFGRNVASSRSIGVFTTDDPASDDRARITFTTVAGGSSSNSRILFETNTYGVSGGERARIDESGNLIVTGPGGLGYGTGSGGTVTQGAGSGKATAVTLNKTNGQITLNNAALNADTTVSFTLTNSTIAATDVLMLNHISGGTAGSYLLNAQAAAGSATINVRNITAGNLSEAIVIGFAVIKAVTA